MEQDIVETITSIITSIVKILGQDFSLNNLIEYIQRERKKKLIIINKHIHMAYPGLCMSLVDADIIIILPNLEKIGREFYLQTLLHELVHVYLGHAKQSDIDYATFEQKLNSIPLVHKDASGNYEKFQEKIAELAGTLLKERIMQHERNNKNSPTYIQRMFS